MPAMVGRMDMDSRISPPRVLVIGGEDAWCQRLVAYLEGSGLKVEFAGNEAAAQAWLGRAFDILLVDVQLASGAGLSICRRLASQKGRRIIAVGAATDEAEAIVALEIGADDYVLKSVHQREVLARIRAHARRLAETGPLQLTFEFSGFTWDLRRRQISAPDGRLLTLSSCEIALLVALLQSAGQELSREELRDLVARDGVDVNVRAIDSHVSRLRRKLADHGRADLITTVYGVGYRWTREEESSAFPGVPPAAAPRAAPMAIPA